MTTKSNNFLMMLAAFLVIALGIMGYMIYTQDKTLKSLDKATFSLSKQSSSDETSKIEDDLEDTDFSNLDKEVFGIESEINASY